MKFSYEELISGDVIPVAKIGHIRSPYLWELKPTKGIGSWNYNFYLNLLSWDKETCMKFAEGINLSPLKAMRTNERLTTFDVMTLMDNFRKLLQEVMAFFMDENLVWDSANFRFETHSKKDDSIVGYINRDNFDEVRDMMLQVNYISIGDSGKPTKYTSEKAKQLWEQAQECLKKSAKTNKDKNLEMANIISKLCAVSSGYTLLNIYDLTVFQLYDQFFQYGYLRAMDLNEMAFSNHGGKNFDFQAWLKPIFKN
jgi:hypothetical protein